MKKVRSGFTMIELIFVIVVIGIISSIALPKLSASRDDAKITAEVASLKQKITNLKSLWIAQGPNYTKGNGNSKTLYSNTDCFRVLLWHNTNNGYQLYYAPYDVSHGGMPAGSCNYHQNLKDKIYQRAVDIGLLDTIRSSKNIILQKRKMSL